MYIVQMSDLHIGSLAKTVPGEEEFFHRCLDLIKEKIPSGEDILLCLCGDIIDSRNLSADDTEEAKKRYDDAAELMDLCKEELGGAYQVSIRCCPGNHDITHAGELYGFCKKLGGKDITLEQLLSCYAYSMGQESGYCIFVSTCMGNQYEVGRIDYKALEEQLRKLPRESSKILVFHHTIMSMYDEDASSIRNAAKLLVLIDKYNITGVLHGHIHGRESLTLGRNQCNVIGTGALFTRNNPNINSQFNIMRYKNGQIIDIRNYRFNADGGYEPWDVVDLDKTIYENNFEGKTFSEVYERLIGRMDGVTPLYNVAIQMKSSYLEFDSNIQEYLRDDYLEVAGKKYDYFSLAKMWEASKVPPELYYNHGSYFKSGGRSGIDFVREQLLKRPDSNRIILSTYNMDETANSQDNTSFLPSLESMQFGLDVQQKELLVYIKFRALEADKFLKITICEIAYILRDLQKKSVEFNKVRVSIQAFRVRRIDLNNCFMKSRIDLRPVRSLGAKINHGKLEELCTLLEEKRAGMESITRMRGIRIILEAMKASNREGGKDAPVHYSSEIIGYFDEILKIHQKLEHIHKSSAYREDEKRYEERIDSLLEQAIQGLKKLEKKKEEKLTNG